MKKEKIRVALSSTGKELTDNLSDVFARCPYFIIAEIVNGEVKESKAEANISAEQLGQAGISAAQLVAEKEVKVVITGNIGPRAMEILNQFNIEVYRQKGSVKENLRKFAEGELKKVN
jgi:predicted Fe-Mo cluster-binding NifX family protein